MKKLLALLLLSPLAYAEISCLNTTLVDKENEIYHVAYQKPLGETYTGKLDANCKRSGKGTYLWLNGNQFIGIWTNDKRVSGDMYYSNGIKQSGNFINDRAHGVFTNYHVDGTVSQNSYRNGQMIPNTFKVIKLSRQQISTNKQNAYNIQRRLQSIDSYTLCLSSPGESLGSCANAWQGYTPKKVYKCDYDVFGNQISSTCREQ